MGGAERVSFYFTGDECLGYTHNLRDYLRWFSVPVVPCRDGSGLTIEVAETRGYIARLVIRRHDSLVGGEVTRRIWYEQAGHQVVTSWKNERHGRSTSLFHHDDVRAKLRREVLCVDTVFVTKVRNYALRAPDKTFSLRDLMSVAMSYSARTIFQSGRSVVDGPNLCTDTLASVVVAVYVDALVQREDMAETVELLQSEAARKKRQTGEPIIAKVVKKTMESLKELLGGTTSYEKVVNQTGIRAAVDAWARARVMLVDVNTHAMFEDVTQWIEVEESVRKAAQESAGVWYEDDVLMASSDWEAVETERVVGMAVDRAVAASTVMRPEACVTAVGPGETRLEDVGDAEKKYAALPTARQRQVRTQTDATHGLEVHESRAYHKFAEVLMRTDVRVGGRVLELGSGRGGTTQLLAERGCEVTAVDVDGAGARATRFIRGDATADATWDQVGANGDKFDGLISDLAVAIGEDYESSQQPLLEAALRGVSALVPGSWTVVKVRGCGGAVRGFVQRLAEMFGRVRLVKPVTSRACSSEVFVVATSKGEGRSVPAAHVSAACREHTKRHLAALEHAVAGGTFEVDIPSGLVETCVRLRAHTPEAGGASIKIGDFSLNLAEKPQWEFGTPLKVNKPVCGDIDTESCWIDDDYGDDGAAVVVDDCGGDVDGSGVIIDAPATFPSDVPWRVVVPCDVEGVVSDYKYTPGRCLFDSIDFLLPDGNSLEALLEELGDDTLARELREGRWGDDEALAVLSRVLGRPVCVHRDDYCVQFGTQGDPAVHVRLSGEHYMPMSCIGTAAADFVHAIAECACDLCRGLISVPHECSRRCVPSVTPMDSCLP